MYGKEFNNKSLILTDHDESTLSVNELVAFISAAPLTGDYECCSHCS